MSLSTTSTEHDPAPDTEIAAAEFHVHDWDVERRVQLLERHVPYLAELDLTNNPVYRHYSFRRADPRAMDGGKRRRRDSLNHRFVRDALFSRDISPEQLVDGLLGVCRSPKAQAAARHRLDANDEMPRDEHRLGIRVLLGLMAVPAIAFLLWSDPTTTAFTSADEFALAAPVFIMMFGYLLGALVAQRAAPGLGLRDWEVAPAEANTIPEMVSLHFMPGGAVRRRAGAIARGCVEQMQRCMIAVLAIVVFFVISRYLLRGYWMLMPTSRALAVAAMVICSATAGSFGGLGFVRLLGTRLPDLRWWLTRWVERAIDENFALHQHEQAEAARRAADPAHAGGQG